MSTTTELRRDFEAWNMQQPNKYKLEWIEEKSVYSWSSTQCAFDAYCAGRSAAHGEQSKEFDSNMQKMHIAQVCSAELSEREAFGKWASAAGYDVAYTYDTERSRHIWLNQMTADLWSAWQARAALSARQAPGGCVIVPKEPTPEMINSVMYWFGNINTARYATEVYNAFIAAAPSTAQKDGVKE